MHTATVASDVRKGAATPCWPNISHHTGSSCFFPSTANLHPVLLNPSAEPPPPRRRNAAECAAAARDLQLAVTANLRTDAAMSEGQAARTCAALIASWAPSTAARYARQLEDWRKFAATSKDCWRQPSVGAVLRWVDHLQFAWSEGGQHPSDARRGGGGRTCGGG